MENTKISNVILGNWCKWIYLLSELQGETWCVCCTKENVYSFYILIFFKFRLILKEWQIHMHLWNNKETPRILHLVSPNDNFLQTVGQYDKPASWHWQNPLTLLPALICVHVCLVLCTFIKSGGALVCHSCTEHLHPSGRTPPGIC